MNANVKCMLRKQGTEFVNGVNDSLVMSNILEVAFYTKPSRSGSIVATNAATWSLGEVDQSSVVLYSIMGWSHQSMIYCIICPSYNGNIADLTPLMLYFNIFYNFHEEAVRVCARLPELYCFIFL